MKKIYAFMLMAGLAFFNAACESDATLDETRLADVTAPSVSLDNVTVNKFDASFTVTLSEKGNPEAREVGVFVSTESQPDMNNSTVLASSDMTEPTTTLTGTFTPGTTFYVCAYVLTANQLLTSEVQSFTTDSHYLGAFLGSKSFIGTDFYTGDNSPIAVTITADEEDETIGYLSGLGSTAGVTLPLEPIKMKFDIEAGTVTIPDGQIINEPNYGPYRYCMRDLSTGDFLSGDNVGIIEDGVIRFETLSALIIEGQNAGLDHITYANITIQ